MEYVVSSVLVCLKDSIPQIKTAQDEILVLKKLPIYLTKRKLMKEKISKQ